MLNVHRQTLEPLRQLPVDSRGLWFDLEPPKTSNYFAPLYLHQTAQPVTILPVPVDNFLAMDKSSRRLKTMEKDGEITEGLYHWLRPSGSQAPWMYGLPKIHKPEVPLRPMPHALGLLPTSCLNTLTPSYPP